MGSHTEPEFTTTTEGFRLRKGEKAATMNSKWFNYYDRHECTFWRMKLHFMEYNDISFLDSKKFAKWMIGLGWRVFPEDAALFDVADYNYIDKLAKAVRKGAFGNSWN